MAQLTTRACESPDEVFSSHNCATIKWFLVDIIFGEVQFVLPARRPSAREIGCPDANDRRRPRPCRRIGVAPALSHGIAFGRGLRPDADHAAAAVRDTPLVVAEEGVLAGERLV